MAKKLPDAELDLMLDDIKNNANEEVVCSAEPTTYTQAHTTFMLAKATMAPADYTKAAGTPDGRKLMMAGKTGVSVLASGTATHVALTDTVNSLLKAVSTCNSQVLASPGSIDLPSWTLTVRQPT